MRGFQVPLNIDNYFIGTLAPVGNPVFVDTFGSLDGMGRATATILVPADVDLIGFTSHHAFAAFDLGPLEIRKVSGAISAILVP